MTMQVHIKNSQFIVSAADLAGCPDDNVPEVCLVGRSNVGKSSLINGLTNRKKLAYISSKPGKTVLLNFFSINNNLLRIVDAPGYGYTALSRFKTKGFATLMHNYLQHRPNLKLVIVLLDLRHKPSELDQKMLDFLRYYKIPYIIAGTKADKLSKNKLNRHLKIIRTQLSLLQNKIITTSSLKKEGFNDLWVEIFQTIVH